MDEETTNIVKDIKGQVGYITSRVVLTSNTLSQTEMTNRLTSIKLLLKKLAVSRPGKETESFTQATQKILNLVLSIANEKTSGSDFANLKTELRVATSVWNQEHNSLLKEEKPKVFTIHLVGGGKKAIVYDPKKNLYEILIGICTTRLLKIEDLVVKDYFTGNIIQITPSTTLDDVASKEVKLEIQVVSSIDLPTFGDKGFLSPRSLSRKNFQIGKREQVGEIKSPSSPSIEQHTDEDSHESNNSTIENKFDSSTDEQDDNGIIVMNISKGSKEEVASLKTADSTTFNEENTKQDDDEVQVRSRRASRNEPSSYNDSIERSIKTQPVLINISTNHSLSTSAVTLKTDTLVPSKSSEFKRGHQRTPNIISSSESIPNDSIFAAPSASAPNLRTLKLTVVPKIDIQHKSMEYQVSPVTTEMNFDHLDNADSSGSSGSRTSTPTRGRLIDSLFKSSEASLPTIGSTSDIVGPPSAQRSSMSEDNDQVDLEFEVSTVKSVPLNIISDAFINHIPRENLFTIFLSAVEQKAILHEPNKTLAGVLYRISAARNIALRDYHIVDKDGNVLPLSTKLSDIPTHKVALIRKGPHDSIISPTSTPRNIAGSPLSAREKFKSVRDKAKKTIKSAVSRKHADGDEDHTRDIVSDAEDDDDDDLNLQPLSGIIDDMIKDQNDSIRSMLFLTYSSFCTPQIFFSAIVDKYKLTDDKYVKTKCLELFELWISDYLDDFFRHDTLQSLFNDFSNFVNENDTDFVSAVESLQDSLCHTYTTTVRKKLNRTTLVFTNQYTDIQVPPPSIIPDGQPNLFNCDTLELARQLTLIDYGLFFCVKPWDF
eukprot:TRINITY_DN1442_c0_g1_i3.p1 TRINITY_DN1442_c0_g1~~TRINITY_DN1442_c0_g1_i3.p1  ORF type:complete len:827 (+),score=196.94 TRINITY_DN1442_c0_g1_i3:348-2828(+)